MGETVRARARDEGEVTAAPPGAGVPLRALVAEVAGLLVPVAGDAARGEARDIVAAVVMITLERGRR